MHTGTLVLRILLFIFNNESKWEKESICQACKHLLNMLHTPARKRQAASLHSQAQKGNTLWSRLNLSSPQCAPILTLLSLPRERKRQYVGFRTEQEIAITQALFPQIYKWRERRKRVHSQGERELGTTSTSPFPPALQPEQLSQNLQMFLQEPHKQIWCAPSENQRVKNIPVCIKTYLCFFLVWQHISLHHFVLNVIFVMTKFFWINAVLFYAPPGGPRLAMGLICKCFNKKDCHGHQRLHKDIKFLD